MYFDIFLTSFGARSSYPVALFSFNWLISTTTFFSVIGSKNTELLYELGYLKDSNAAAHSVDTGIS